MPLSPLIQQHLNQLSHHPHIDHIVQIKPLVYKLTYWPRDLESLYAEIPYTLKLTIPESYPQKPPFITFLQKIYHLNINPSTGQLSMSILTQDWSPFLNLKAVINSLDEILQEPDQTLAATPSLLEQYQTDITTYVENVKESLQKNHIKDNYDKQQHNYSQEQVEEVIQVDDFNEYKIKRPGSNFGSQQDEIQNLQFRTNADFIKLQEDEKHDYSFNHEVNTKDNQLICEIKGQKEQKSDGQLSVKIKKQPLKSLQLKPPVLNIDSQQNSPRQNQNQKISTPINQIIDSKTSLTKYQNIVKQSNNLFKSKNQLEGSFQGLKQNMTRCKQLITIFSEQLSDMEQNMQKNKSKRIKKLLEEKCTKLEQMILELFQISEKTRLKLMDMVRKGVNQYQ